MKLTVRNAEGREVRTIEADDRVFGLEPHRAVVHQALLAHLANRRRGTARTKTRSEVRGSTAKLHRQKGTGRARVGSVRSPTRRGGGVIFGPRPRDFSQRLPKRMRRLAIRSMLSAKAADGSLQVLDALSIEEPRTKEMTAVLHNLGLDRSALVVTAQPDPSVKLSARNLSRVTCLPASYLNVGDLLSHRGLLMTVEAVRVAEALWGGERASKRRAPLVEPAPAFEEEAPKPRRRRRAPKAEQPSEVEQPAGAGEPAPVEES
jgi:large subunit ribosomal protein L4